MLSNSRGLNANIYNDWLTGCCHYSQVDPSTGDSDEEGYEDEYQLEDLEVFLRSIVRNRNDMCSSSWDGIVLIHLFIYSMCCCSYGIKHTVICAVKVRISWSCRSLILTSPSFKFVQVTAADYILKTGVSNFRNAWESLDPELERVDEYGLGVRDSLQDAVVAVSTILGMQPCEVRLATTFQFEALLLNSFTFTTQYSSKKSRKWLWKGLFGHHHLLLAAMIKMCLQCCWSFSVRFVQTDIWVTYSHAGNRYRAE